MSQAVITRPDKSEHAEYFGLYIDKVTDGDILELLEAQVPEFKKTLTSISESDAGVLHEPYTWTIKQVVGHLIDVERVFGYRALRFASGDDRPILGMEQNPWVENTDYQTPSLNDLVEELELARRANLLFFRRIGPDVWDRKGSADGNGITVRALAYCLVGHIIHHLDIIKSRIGLTETKWSWFERKFEFGFPPEKLPDIVERLTGTPVRIEAILSDIDSECLTRRLNQTWSILENVGHLADLEPLWIGRINDILAKAPTMREADLSNRGTSEANHHATGKDALQNLFSRLRDQLIRLLDGLSPDQSSQSSLHPRLEIPMRVVDLGHFVAEHDDYHLARIRYLGKRFSGGQLTDHH